MNPKLEKRYGIAIGQAVAGTGRLVSDAALMSVDGEPVFECAFVPPDDDERSSVAYDAAVDDCIKELEKHADYAGENTIAFLVERLAGLRTTSAVPK